MSGYEIIPEYRNGLVWYVIYNGSKYIGVKLSLKEAEDIVKELMQPIRIFAQEEVSIYDLSEMD